MTIHNRIVQNNTLPCLMNLERDRQKREPSNMRYSKSSFNLEAGAVEESSTRERLT